MLYSAIIIEPRITEALEIVLLNFNRNLNEEWLFLIFHGNNNKQFIENIVKKNNIHLKRNVVLISTGLDNLSIDQYNLLLYSDFFYEHIKTEHFLIFQIDTLLSETASHNIYNFLDYDYVGAPWTNKNEYDAVGNGGLSLRKKSKMLEMIHNGGFIKENGEPHYEDRFFSNTCGNTTKIFLNKPSIEVAKQFSVETVFYDNPVGLHKAWIYLTKEQLTELKKKFPDLNKLIVLHMYMYMASK